MGGVQALVSAVCYAHAGTVPIALAKRETAIPDVDATPAETPPTDPAPA